MTEETEKTTGNPILSLPLEIRMWIDSKIGTDMTHKEILSELLENYPWLGSKGITTRHIRNYRTKVRPEYKELILKRHGLKAEEPEELTPEDEAEILEEVKEAEDEGEEFTKEERRKINMLLAHRRLLKELWTNYQKIKNSREEVAKGRYIQLMAEALEHISQLEASEKSFISALDECRKSELKMSAEKYVDSLEGWFLLRLFEKTKDNKQASEILSGLQNFLSEYAKLLETNSVADTNRQVLERLYAKRKLIEVEKGIV